MVVPAYSHSIKNRDIDTVDSLFRLNRIDNRSFRYLQYLRDTFQTQFPPFTKYDEQVVRVNQYTNNLPVFFDDLSYTFWDRTFHYQSGILTNGTTLDTIPELTIRQVRKLFIDDIEKFDHAAPKYKDLCFKTEFGYYNLNAGIPNTQEIIVKAWRVTIEVNPTPLVYPIAYYQDKSGKLILYDNGVVTFK